METSDAPIIIFCKVVFLTVHLASQLKLSLTLGSLLSLCVFLLEMGCGELVMLTHYVLMLRAAAFPEQLLFLTDIMLYTGSLISCIFYLLIRSCSLYIAASFIVLILLYVPRWSSIFVCVFYFAFAEVAESFNKHQWRQVEIIT